MLGAELPEAGLNQSELRERNQGRVQLLNEDVSESPDIDDTKENLKTWGRTPRGTGKISLIDQKLIL